MFCQIHKKDINTLHCIAQCLNVTAVGIRTYRSILNG